MISGQDARTIINLGALPKPSMNLNVETFHGTSLQGFDIITNRVHTSNQQRQFWDIF